MKQSLIDIMNLRSLASMLICAILSSMYYQFLTLSNQLLIVRFGQSESEAKNKVTIFLMEIIISTPILGLIVDKVGRKPMFLMISSFLTVISFFTLFFFPEEKSELIHFPLFLLSQYFSIFNTVIWPTMMISVPSRSVGICLGIGALLESSLMSIMPIIFGFILSDNSVENYQLAITAFCAIAVFSLFLCTVLWRYDQKNGRLLSRLEDDKEVEKLRRKMTKKNDQFFKDKRTEQESKKDSEDSSSSSKKSPILDIFQEKPKQIERKVSFSEEKSGKKRNRFFSEGKINDFSKLIKDDAIFEKLEEKVDKINEDLDVSVIEEVR